MRIKSAVVLLTGMLCALAEAQAAPSPNIVFILADDLGIGDLGITNQNARAAAGLPAVLTPNIDALALGGARFNNMYAGASVCAPTRAAMLTGFHSGHNSIDRINLNQDIRIGEEDKTWGQVLQQAGYRTGQFGKWHVGGVNNTTSDIRTFGALPTQKGFEVSYGSMFGVYRLYTHWTSSGDGGMHKVNVPADPTWPGPGLPQAYGDDILTNRAVDFIRTNATASDPFMAYVAMTEPHAPFDQVPQDHPYVNMPWPKVQRDYAGLIWRLDQHVKQVVDAVEDPNGDGNKADSIAANTMIVFASDNGPSLIGTGGGFDPNFFDSNGIYAGTKFSNFDGGVRTPFFVRWDGQVTPGTVNNAYVGSLADLMPTFAELAGQDAPLGVDARSMVDQLAATPATPEIRPQIWSFPYEVGAQNPGGWAIRLGDWKLMKRRPSTGIPTTTYLLYNLANDPREQVNLANARPDIRNALEAIGIAEGLIDQSLGTSLDNPNVIEDKNTYFTQYKHWAPQSNSEDFLLAENWAGGTQRDVSTSPEALYWNTGPAANWLASMVNTTGTARQAVLNADVSVLALGLAGPGATMRVVVPNGRKLSARNGVRIEAGGTISLQGGEINTVRDVEIREGAVLAAHGTITGQQASVAGIPEFAGLRLFEPRVVNGGTLDVGVGPTAGVLSILGEYQQTATGTLHVNLFGSSGGAGLAFDQLAVQRGARLAGVLDVDYGGGPWQPQLGDTFQILTALDGVSGFFSTASMPPLAPGWTWNILYSPTAVSLQVIEQAQANLIIAAGQPLGATVTIAGGQNITLGGNLRIGNGANPGELTVNTGGFVSVGGTTTLEAAGVLKLAGGTLRTGTLNHVAGGGLQWQSGVLNFSGNLQVAAGQGLGADVQIAAGQTLDVDGQLVVDGGFLTVGTGGEVRSDTGVSVGVGGALVLNGGLLATPALQIAGGGFAWNSGTLRFTDSLDVAPGMALGASATIGAAQRLETLNDLHVGVGAAAGGLAINAGGQVAVADQTTIGSAGTLTLAGGLLETVSLVRTAGGAFDWQSGTLRFTGDLSVAAAGDLGAMVGLTSGRRLEVANNLAIGAGSLTIGAESAAVVGGATTIADGGWVTLAGGLLSTHSLARQPGGTLLWSAGTLRFTEDLSVSAAGDLGSAVTISVDRILEVADDLGVAGGGLSIDAGGAVTVGDATSVGAGGTVTLAGGSLTTATLATADGGAFVWSSGSLQLTADLTIAEGRVLDHVTLGTGKSLAAPSLRVGEGAIAGNLALDHGSAAVVAGATMVDAGGTLDLDGGALTTGSLAVNAPGAVRFDSGSLTITGVGGLAIAETGPLGKTASVVPGQTLAVTGPTSIAAGASLAVTGGSFTTGVLAMDGGTFDAVNLAGVGAIAFDAGVIRLSGAQALAGDGPLGAEVALGTDQTIEVAGALDVGSAAHPALIALGTGSLLAGQGGTTIRPGSLLVLDGGTFATASLAADAGGSFGWNTGTLRFTADFAVEPGGQLGDAITLAAAQRLEVANGLSIGSAELTIQTLGSAAVGGTTAITSGGTLQLAGGKLSTAALTIASGGSFGWQAGELAFTADQTIGTGGVVSQALGGSLSIGAGRHLNVAGTATLTNSLVLAGGTLSVGQIAGAELLDFSVGTLNITGTADLVVGAGGPFGPTLNVAGTAAVNAAGAVLVAPGALASVADGGALGAPSIVNNGEILLNGPTAAVAAGLQFANAGMLRGNGRVGGPVVNQTAGTIQVDAGQRLHLLGAALANNGHVTVAGTTGVIAELDVDGAATNAATTGLITAAHGRLRFDGGLINAGSLTATAGDVHVYGDIDNTGQLVVTGGATATFYGDVVQNGAIQVSKVGDVRSTAVFLGDVSGAGGATGDGDLYFEGDLRPGNSPALVNYAASVFLGANSALNIEIGGLLAGAEYDQLAVTGALTLGGALDVDLLGGFAPGPGQSFTIATAAGGIAGSFANLSLPELIGAAWRINRTANALVLEVHAAAPDFDGNGRVDGLDFLVWQRNLGRFNAAPGEGDANGDTLVNAADLAIWRAAMLGGGAVAAAAAIPEPASGALAVAAALTFAGFTRRRARCAGR